MTRMPRVTDILYLNPRELEPDLQGVRTNVGDLVGLAESIREQGVLQPLGVVENSGTHRVVFGNRRREAAIIVGLDRVPCLLLEHQEEVDRLTCQLLENIQRKSLNDMEQGEALLRLRSEMGKASGRDASETSLNEKVAKRLGLSPRTVQRYVSLCKLPLAVQEAIRRDELTVTQAQHLHGLGIATRQEVVALLAIEEGMSAAELRQLCASLASNPNIDPHEALKRQRQGLAVDAIAPGPTTGEAAVARLPRRSLLSAEEDDDSDLWTDDEEVGVEEEAAFRCVAPVATADGNRRFRIRSLDSFMDELARLVRCVEEGDLSRFSKGEAEAELKLNIAKKQVAYLARALESLI